MPTSRLYSLLAALPLAVLAMPIGCAAEADPEETGDTSVDSTADELKSLVIDDDDNGKTFNVTAGQNVVVKLSSNPTTGYKWHVSSTDRTFGYPAKDVYTASKPAAVGSGGVQTLTWKTAGGFPVTGKHTVKLEYQRPWAETAPPAKTFTFTVDVRAATPTCANVRCASGTHCEMKGINGGAIPACIKDLPACKTTGCSGQICADHDVMTTCEYRAEYACYRAATCERQADGQCGFTKTAALTACLAR